MIGIDVMYVWVLVWILQQFGWFEWLGLDFINDQLVDQCYIVVGCGCDYVDVLLLCGIIYINFENSVIDVFVDVVFFEGDVLYV